MNLDVTVSATGVLRILVVRWTSRLVRAHTMVHAVARQAQMVHRTELQHSRVSGSMRCVTDRAAVGFHRSVFERKWTLLIGVTLDTCSISANCQPCLF